MNPRRASLFTLLALFLLFSISQIECARQLLVSPTLGDDASDCAQPSPCASLRRAFSLASVDDVIVLLNGTHVINQTIDVLSSVTLAKDRNADLVRLTAPSLARNCSGESENCAMFRVYPYTVVHIFDITGPIEIFAAHTFLVVKPGQGSVKMSGLRVSGLTHKFLETQGSELSLSTVVLNDIEVSDCDIDKSARALILAYGAHLNVRSSRFSRITCGAVVFPKDVQPALIQSAGTFDINGIVVRDSSVSLISGTAWFNGARMLNVVVRDNVVDQSCIHVIGKPAVSLLLNNISISGVRYPGAYPRMSRSAALYLEGLDQITLFDFTFYGGGLFATIILQNSGQGLVIDNSLIECGGQAGIWVTHAGLTIQGSTLRNCYSHFGGAIASDTGSVTINNSAFSGNWAMQDGGGGAVAALYPTFFSILSSNFTNNQATTRGGAILAIGKPMQTTVPAVVLNNVIFKSNHAGTVGGAISVEQLNLVINEHAIFEANDAYEGGAVHIVSSQLLFNAMSDGHVVFTKNKAETFGGAISVASSTVILTGRSYAVDLIDNRAENGAGVYTDDDAQMSVLGSCVNQPCRFLCASNKASVAGACVYFGEHAHSSLPISYAKIFSIQDSNTAGAYGHGFASYPKRAFLSSDLTAVAPSNDFMVHVKLFDMLNNTVKAVPLVAALSMTGQNCSEPIRHDVVGDQELSPAQNLELRHCGIPGTTVSLSVSIIDHEAIETNRVIVSVLSCPFGYILHYEATSSAYECTRILEFAFLGLAGLVILVLVFIFAIAAITFAAVQMVRRKQQDAAVKKLLGEAYYDLQAVETLEEPLLASMPRGIKEFTLNPEDIRIKGFIAAGAQASVHSAELNGSPVALKLYARQTFIGQSASLDALENELTILKKLRHPAIVNFIGVVIYSSKIGICLELMQMSLAQFIMSCDATRKDVHDLVMPWSLKLHILQQVASAMAFVHGQSISHRDLKPENCLLNGIDLGNVESWHRMAIMPTVKVADFASSRVIKSDSNATLGVGTSSYIAPELYGAGSRTAYGTIASCSSQSRSQGGSNGSSTGQGQYSLQCDVYSFAIVMYAVLFETTRPFGFMSDADILYAVRAKDARPPLQDLQLLLLAVKQQCESYMIPINRTHEIILQVNAAVTLMQRCWQKNADDRPTMKEIVKTLDNLI